MFQVFQLLYKLQVLQSWKYFPINAVKLHWKRDGRQQESSLLQAEFISSYPTSKNLDFFFPSCRGFFCAGRSLADPIPALPLLCILSMSVMLSRALNIFIASLSQNSRISSSISQDTLLTFFHRIMTLFDSQIPFPKPPCSSCSLLLSKCNFFHLVPTKPNSISRIVPSICRDHFEFWSCPPEHLQAHPSTWRSCFVIQVINEIAAASKEYRTGWEQNASAPHLLHPILAGNLGKNNIKKALNFPLLCLVEVRFLIMLPVGVRLC